MAEVIVCECCGERRWTVIARGGENSLWPADIVGSYVARQCMDVGGGNAAITARIRARRATLAEERQAKPKCTSVCPVVVGYGSPTCCALELGHAGHHANGETNWVDFPAHLWSIPRCTADRNDENCCHPLGHSGHHETQITGHRFGWFQAPYGRVDVAIMAGDTAHDIERKLKRAVDEHTAAYRPKIVGSGELSAVDWMSVVYPFAAKTNSSCRECGESRMPGGVPGDVSGLCAKCALKPSQKPKCYGVMPSPLPMTLPAGMRTIYGEVAVGEVAFRRTGDSTQLTARRLVLRRSTGRRPPIQEANAACEAKRADGLVSRDGGLTYARKDTVYGVGSVLIGETMGVDYGFEDSYSSNATYRGGVLTGISEVEHHHKHELGRATCRGCSSPPAPNALDCAYCAHREYGLNERDARVRTDNQRGQDEARARNEAALRADRPRESKATRELAKAHPWANGDSGAGWED